MLHCGLGTTVPSVQDRGERTTKDNIFSCPHHVSTPPPPPQSFGDQSFSGLGGPWGVLRREGGGGRSKLHIGQHDGLSTAGGRSCHSAGAVQIFATINKRPPGNTKAPRHQRPP